MCAYDDLTPDQLLIIQAELCLFVSQLHLQNIKDGSENVVLQG